MTGSGAEQDPITPAEAFARHVEPEVPVLFRVARTLASQPADAEDLVQDCLVRAYRSIDRFDGEHPRAWLLTILRNTHRNRARVTVPRLLSRDQQDAGALERDGEQSAEDVVVGATFDAGVAAAVAELPSAQRVLVQLVDIDGLSYAEAADAVGIPRGTVMSRLHRGRSRIRARLMSAGLVPRRART